MGPAAITIPLLDGKNFSQWEFKLTAMKSKSETTSALERALQEFATTYDIHVSEGSTLRADAERVFGSSRSFAKLLTQQKMVHQASPPYTHQLNGVVERKIQVLFDSTRALLLQAKMPSQYWPVALHHAVHIHNCCPTSALAGLSPLEVLTGKKPRLSALKVFGCAAYVRVDDTTRTALEPKSKLGVYVGIDPQSGSNRIMMFNAKRMSFVRSIHCTFDESSMAFPVVVSVKHKDVTARQTVTVSDTAGPKLAADRDPLLDPHLDEPPSVSVSSAVTPTNASAQIPNSYKAAMRSSHRTQWTAATEEEIASHRDNATFTYVPLTSVPNDRKPLHSKWVFSIKETPDGSTRYKARLVARGDAQKRDVDFGELFSPVVNHSTLRAMLAVATLQDYELDHMDAVTAFLNASIDEDIYMHIPDGFDPKPGYVLKVQKSLYGLRQAPRAWNSTLHNFLINKGFQQSAIDPCLYFIPGKIWVAIWVDDFLVMAKMSTESFQFKREISSRFKMRDLGPIKHFLGLDIARDRANRTLSITATPYINKMLSTFGMTDAKGAETPFPSGITLAPTPPEIATLPASFAYRAIVGSILYLALLIRPDIAFHASQLARYQDRPSMTHWNAAKHVLRYLVSTKDFGLTYSARNTTTSGEPHFAADELHGYADASWGEDPSTRRSQTGFAFILANAAISFKTSLQHTVALSSTEAEYLSLASAVKEVLYLRNLLCDLGLSLPMHTTVLEDNQSTIKMALNQASSARTKHIDIRHHFLKSHVNNGNVTLRYVSTEHQAADCLTKSLDRVKLTSFRRILLGV